MVYFFLIVGVLWIFFSLFGGNYLTGTSLCTFLILFALHIRNTYFPIVLFVIPLLSASVISILFWREFYRKPKYWKRIEILLCSIASFLILVLLIIPQSKLPNHGIFNCSLMYFILITICFLVITFFMTKMFIAELLFFLINQFKTESKQIVTGKVKRIFSKYEHKYLSHYMVIDNTNENIKINIITIFYLKLFAENKTIEIEFKKGFLGLEYSNRFPNIVL